MTNQEQLGDRNNEPRGEKSNRMKENCREKRISTGKVSCKRNVWQKEGRKGNDQRYTDG
jgi:hypothetical protein